AAAAGRPSGRGRAPRAAGGRGRARGPLARLARWRAVPPPPRLGDRRGGRVAPLLAGGRRASIHEHDAKRLLAEAGLPVVPERLVADLPGARAAAAALGYPVVLKAVSDDIPHRSDLGLVAVGLAD